MYENRFKQELEPAHNNEFVSIHVPTGDFAVAGTRRAAASELLTRHPVDGKIISMKIGQEPDYGLAARVLGIARSGSRMR
jgi:hypothetical protein